MPNSPSLSGSLKLICRVALLLAAATLSACGGGGGGGDSTDYGCLFLLLTGLIIFAPDCSSSPPPASQPSPPRPLPTPTAPSNLVANVVSPAQIDLSWSPSNVRNYNIYRDGKFVKSTFTTSASDTGLDPSTQYCYTVTVASSVESDEACAATPEDVIPPTPPAGLTATSVSSGAQQRVISLSWNGSSDNGVVRGYKIYRDGLQAQDLTRTSFSDAGLDSNIQYCYTVSAYDTAGNESAQSEPACTTTAATGWNITVVDAGVDVQSTAIGLDALDHVHISYQDGRFIASAQQVGNVKYATNASGSWSTSIIDNVGSTIRASASIAVDIADAVHIAYYAFDARNIKHAIKTSGIWNSEVIDRDLHLLNVAIISLALDAAGHVHLVYDDDVDLLHANNAGGFWTTEVVGDISTNKVAAIAVDSSNAVHIAYYYYPTGELRYVSNATESWSTQTVDSQDDVGRHVAIAVDAAGRAHISYYDATNRDLKYTTNTSGVWITETVDSQGDVGTSTSIGVDSAGKVHISYTDDTNHDLKYATNASGAWLTYVIDSAWVSGIVSSPGADTSIAVDSIGKMHISYRENGALKYATNR
jgi:hypothetical protein